MSVLELPKITNAVFTKIKTELIQESIKSIDTDTIDDGLRVFVHPKTVLFSLVLIGVNDQEMRLISIIEKYKGEDTLLYSLDTIEKEGLCLNIAVLGFTTKPRISALSDRYFKIVSLFHHPEDSDVNTYSESFKVAKLALYKITEGTLIMPNLLGNTDNFKDTEDVPMDTVMSNLARWVKSGQYTRLAKTSSEGDVIDFGGDVSNTKKFDIYVAGTIKFLKGTADMWRVRHLRESDLAASVKNTCKNDNYFLSDLNIPDVTNIPKNEVKNIIARAADIDFKKKTDTLSIDPLDIAIEAQNEYVGKSDKQQRTKEAYSPYRKNIEYYLYINIDDVFYYKQINGGKK